MAKWKDVDVFASQLPEVTSRIGGHDKLRQWQVRNKTFVWERPLRKSDIEALGEDAPPGPILGAWLPDEGAKFALIADDPAVYFTTPHFDGYSPVLVQLDTINKQDLKELLTEAWLVRAPKRLAATLDEPDV